MSEGGGEGDATAVMTSHIIAEIPLKASHRKRDAVTSIPKKMGNTFVRENEWFVLMKMKGLDD